jgi:hypothetical protein
MTPRVERLTLLLLGLTTALLIAVYSIARQPFP